MASLLQQAFGTSELDLYKDVLHVDKSCAPSQLRKAYYKQAMVYHPDKNPSPDAKHKFQAISWTYNFLKDPEKRKDYDEDGILPHNDADDDDDDSDDEFGGGGKSWKDYFDLIFGKLTTNDIDSFAMKYKMSEEEEKDVLENYTKFKGNLSKMLEYVMLSSERDAQRWVEDFIQPAIDAGKVENFDKTLTKSLEKINKKLRAEEKKSKRNNDEDEEVDEEDNGQSETMAVDPDETETEGSEKGDDGDDDGSDRKPTAKSKSKKQDTKSSKVKATKAKPTKSKAKAKKKSKSSSSELDLIAAIRNKNRGGTNPLAGIAARYGVTMPSDDFVDPLDDESFARIQSSFPKKKNKK